MRKNVQYEIMFIKVRKYVLIRNMLKGFAKYAINLLKINSLVFTTYQKEQQCFVFQYRMKNL